MNENFTDIDVVNEIRSIERFADYGKYDILNLRESIIRSGIVMSEYDIAALERLGFVDVEYSLVPSDLVGDRIATLYTLNNRWRNLRRFGTYSALIEWENNERNAEEDKIKTEREFIKEQKVFQTLNHDYIQKQEQLIDNQIETNRITKITNILIAIFTGVAAIWYFRDVLDKLIPSTNKNKDWWIISATSLLFLVEIVGFRKIILTQWRKKKVK